MTGETSSPTLTTGERKTLTSSYSTFRPQKKKTFGITSDGKKRAAKKTAAIRKLFAIEDGALLFDISASIKTCQTKLAGRLFIMDKYLLFFSDMFKIEQKVNIPVIDIATVMTDPDQNTVSVEVKSSKSSFVFLLAGRYKEDVLKYFKTMDSKFLPSPPERDAKQSDATDSTTESNTSDDDEDDEGLEWISRAAKEEGFLRSDGHEVVIREELPITIKKFYDLFMKDETFFAAFYKHLNRTEISTTEWQTHEELGHLRQASFRVKVNSPIGPPTTMMDETQRYYHPSGDANHLILEITNVARDVKYGDSFRVEIKFNLTGAGNTTKLEISVGVSFIKKIYVPGIPSMIKSKSIEDSTAAYVQWVTFAKKHIEEHSNAGLTKNISSPKNLNYGSGSRTAPASPASPASPSDKEIAPSTPAPRLQPAQVSPPAPSSNSGFDVTLVLLVALLLVNLYLVLQNGSINKRLDHLESTIAKFASCSLENHPH